MASFLCRSVSWTAGVRPTYRGADLPEFVSESEADAQRCRGSGASRGAATPPPTGLTGFVPVLTGFDTGVATPAGLQPATSALGKPCSMQLSYGAIAG